MSYMKRILIMTIFSVFWAGAVASAGTYTDSAHGDSSSGVERDGLFGEYGQGNCAHCHEQHASLDGSEPAPNSGNALGPDSFCLLADNWSGSPITNPYDQDDCSCFYCHSSTSSLQYTAFSNYSYSRTFGGYTSDSTASIMDAFNLTSYHNLYDLYEYITGASGSKSFSDFPEFSSPCSGCHNVHLAKRNRETPGDPSNTAISKPSGHDSLWGDDSPGERMTAAAYGSDYQPPYYNSSSSLEPDGQSGVRADQAAKTPDYNTFCIDCHNSSNTIYSTSLGRNLKTIDWDNEKHGKGDATDYITVDGPYTPGSGSLGYVLSCLDCHEPHGSGNAFLIREEVNGGAVGGSITSFSDGDWHYLCNRCHQDDYEMDSGCPQDSYYNIHHDSSSGDPYHSDIRQCSECHSPAFTPETRVVMHDRTYRPIGEIEAGDRVMGFDFRKNRMCEAEVVRKMSDDCNKTIEVNGVTTTPEQRFAVGRDLWKKAGELKAGGTVLGSLKNGTDLGKFELDDPVCRENREEVEVIEITVADTHNFFVLGRLTKKNAGQPGGEKDIPVHFLVHNPNDCTTTKPQKICTDCHYHGSTHTEGSTWRTF